MEYNILGASVAVMPLSEIATYLGFKLFESYRDMFDRMPTEQERDAFLQATQLKYDDIRKALSKGCAPQINFPQRYDAKLFKERNNGQFVDFAENEYLGKNKGVLEKNSLAFMAAMKDYTIPDDSTSLISRTYKGLCEKYVTNLDYGPFFAQRMLYGTQNKNLIHESFSRGLPLCSGNFSSRSARALVKNSSFCLQFLYSRFSMSSSSA